MKLVNVLRNAVLVAAALSVVGCATAVGSAAKQGRASDSGKQWDKEAYGMVFYATDKDSRAVACHGSLDDHCRDENYVPVLMAVSFGFADAGRGLWAMAHKDDLKDFVGGNSTNYETKACTTRSPTKCFWGKFNIKENGVADFAGIVQKPGDKSPCRWSGLPGNGGTVCESLNFDYRKANLPVTRNW